MDEASFNQRGWEKGEKVRLNKIGFLRGYISSVDLNPAALCRSIVFLYHENTYLEINFNNTEKVFTYLESSNLVNISQS